MAPKKGSGKTKAQNNILNNDADLDLDGNIGSGLLEDSYIGGPEMSRRNDPGIQLSLPNRAARKAMLREMEASQAKGQAGNIAGYEAYVAKFKALDELMDELGALDVLMQEKPLTAADQEKLSKAMQETALAGETYLANVRKETETDPQVQPDKGVPGLVGKLQGMLSHDYETVQAYDPAAKPMSLPKLMEESRCRTIELGSEQIDALGGAQSSRIPMSIVNEKGEKRQGFLTKASTVNIRSTYENAIEKAAQSAPSEAGAQALRGMLQKYREYKKFGPDKSDEYVIAYMINANFRKDKPLNDINLKLFMVKIGLRPKDMGQNAVRRLAEDLKPLNKVSVAFNGLDHHFTEGERIDRRNSGMSAIAALLGKPDLLARSTDIKFKDKDGRILEGTFMDYGKGLDLNTADLQTFKHINDVPFVGSSKPGQLIRQLADMQVIDFISGNLDRHCGNLMYITDADGKLIGVQGIDNDCSLGTARCDGKSNYRLPGLDNMGIISESMAKKIMAMDPAMLKFSLRGKGLTEEQLDHAALRLGSLQQAIEKGKEYYKDKPLGKGKAYDEGYLRTVSDKDFANLSLTQMQLKDRKDKNAENLFEMVDRFVKVRGREARRRGILYEPNAEKAAAQLKDIKTDTAFIKEKIDVGQLRETLSGAGGLVRFQKTSSLGVKTVDELTHGTNGSKQFADMVKAVRTLEQLEENYRKEKKDGLQLSSQEYTRQYRLMQEALQTLKDTRNLYIARKMGQRKAATEEDLVGKNDYERKRIQYAKNVGGFLARAEKRFNRLAKPEGLFGDAENVKAMDTMAELDEKQKAMEMVRKFNEEHGLKAPEVPKRNLKPVEKPQGPGLGM